jgi:Tfp pilus assembly protein PilX
MPAVEADPAMKLLPSNSRGMALVMAMIVVVLITMLVAGAISFTGTERGAAQLQERGDQMSSCIQAARNLFVSRMRTIPATSVELVSFDEALTLDENGVPDTTVATRHFAGTPTAGGLTELRSVTDATNTVQDPSINVEGIDQKPGNPQGTKFYAITAVCRETNDPGSPEREIEFLVRVGL